VRKARSECDDLLGKLASGERQVGQAEASVECSAEASSLPGKVRFAINNCYLIAPRSCSGVEGVAERAELADGLDQFREAVRRNWLLLLPVRLCSGH